MPSISGDHPDLIIITLLLVGVCSVATPVNAAGSTVVEISPAEAKIDIGNTTTVDIIVVDTDGGVGAYELTVELDDPDIAHITDVTRLGDPGIGRVDTDSDRSSANVEAGLMDTANTGSVTITRVTIEGDANGTTAIQLTIQALGDEAGSRYDVTASRDATLAVGSGTLPDDETHTSQPSSTTGGDSDGGAGPSKSPRTASTSAETANNPVVTAETTLIGTPQPTVTSENSQGRSSKGSSAAPTGSTTSPQAATQSSSDGIVAEVPGFEVHTGLLSFAILIVILWNRVQR